MRKLFLLCIVCIAFADVPALINYQGKIADADGLPVEGELSITFRIYDAAAGGSNLWEESQTVTVLNGVYNTLLGSVAAFDEDLFDGAERYLSIQVGDDEESSSRSQLVSTPYAINAKYLNGKSFSAFQNIYSISESGTHYWEAPTGISLIKVQLWGAGGGAGGNNKDCCSGDPDRGAGQGGGAGGYVESYKEVVPGTIYEIFIGAGGSAGGNGCYEAYDGTDGESSNFLDMIADGGIRGAGHGNNSLGQGGSGNGAYIVDGLNGIWSSDGMNAGKSYLSDGRWASGGNAPYVPSSECWSGNSNGGQSGKIVIYY